MNPLVRTARVAGTLYLAYVVLIVLATVVDEIRLPYAMTHPDGPSAASWVTWPIIVVEVLAAGIQLLAAVWLGRLFRATAEPAARWIVPLGVGCAVVQLLLSASRAWDAVYRSSFPVHHPRLGADVLFPADAILFALWMIVIGWCVWRSRLLPRVLGVFLIAGSIANLIYGGLPYLGIDSTVVDYTSTGVAIVGDLWLIGYLLMRGVRQQAPEKAEVSGR